MFRYLLAIVRFSSSLNRERSYSQCLTSGVNHQTTSACTYFHLGTTNFSPHFTLVLTTSVR